MPHTYAFEKMAAWQNSRRVAKTIYWATRNFPKEELFGITSQIRRSAVSISCNLAEGSGRFSEKDQNRFYEIAYGSALEVINLLIISNDLEYIPDEEYASVRQEIERITFQINKLVNRNPPGANEPDAPYFTEDQP